jgi:hypothetical protein
MKCNRRLIAGTVFVLSLLHGQLVAQSTRLTWTVFDAGFGQLALSNGTLKSSVGQSFVGRASFANSFLESGFFADTLFRGTITDVEEGTTITTLPLVYALRQNYPNPFNPSTTIRYEVPKLSRVNLKVYNILGQEIMELVNQDVAPGVYNVRFNASNLPSGVYFYRVQMDEVGRPNGERFSDVKKFMLVK